MKKISSILFVFVFFLAISLSAITKVSAANQTTLCPPGFTSLCTINVANGGGGIVGGVVQILLVLAIIFSLFFLIWGGIRYILSGGDKGKIDQARSTIIAALVGLVISLGAFFIVNVLLSIFTGQGLSGLSMPNLLSK